jgi:endonuclease YncB( thermonuclease family)
MRKTVLIAVLTVVALSFSAATAAAPAVTGGAFTSRGTVTHIVDGDTLDVRLTSGKTERIRLIGIDTPERGVCYFSQATARARQLAMSKQVVLRGDPTQDTRDRYGRLLAYVWLPGGKDLGYQLISGGFAKVYVYRNPTPVRLSECRRCREGRDRRAMEGMCTGCCAGPSAGARAGSAAADDAGATIELPFVLLAVPADRRRPRLRRHPCHGRRAGSRSRLGSVPARRRQRRARLRVDRL